MLHVSSLYLFTQKNRNESKELKLIIEKEFKLTAESFIVSVCSGGFDLVWLTNATQLFSFCLFNRMGAGMRWKSSQTKIKIDRPLTSYHHGQKRLGENYFIYRQLEIKQGSEK